VTVPPVLSGLPDRSTEFSFVLLSDRTGMAQPGVFERGVEITNLLRPDFAIQVGDVIEGYTRDPGELDRQWKEFEEIAARLEVPLVRVPGNHDVGNAVMREAYLARHGVLHHHFRYRDVLFLVLDTQDPPQTLAQMLRPADGGGAGLPAAVRDLLADPAADEQEVIAAMGGVLADRAAAAAFMGAIKDGTQPGHVSDAQVDELVAAVQAHPDVRWTVLLMHMPIWQGAGHPALTRLHDALGDRPFTAFAGHCHNYRRTVVRGRDHIRLGSTGGIRMVDTPAGNFDHVTRVTMTADGPRLLTVLVDGVRDDDGEELSGRLD
jgi:serine/threonine-protein phosphatase CPPED1